MNDQSIQQSLEKSNYRALVEQMFDENSPALVSNSCTEHAIILIETLLSRATKDVRILCRDLDPVAYDEPSVIQSIVDAAAKGVAIRILVQNEPMAKRLLQVIQSDFGSKKAPEIRVCNDVAKVCSDGVNFVVADSKSFRIEEDLDRKVATASANHPTLAGRLVRLFDRIWPLCTVKIA